MTEIGHNSGDVQRATKSELLDLAQRIERLKDEKAAEVAEYNEQIKEVRAECKARGYDMKALDQVLRLRALDNDTRAVVHLYADALEVFG